MSEKKRILTQGDVVRFFIRWSLCCETPHSYERMQAPALCFAFIPALKKMYPNPEDKQLLADALTRHNQYFNTQGVWGASVLGIALGMEEEQAITRAMDAEQANTAINGVKTGFMGPMAGVGDTIDWSTLQYIFIGIALPYTSQGNAIGVFLDVITFSIIMHIEGILMTTIGYRFGRESIAKLFEGGLVNLLISTSAIIGMMMMGSLSGNYVKFSLASETIQGVMDKILPGMLPCLAVFIVYIIMTKVTDKVGNIALGIIVVSLVLSILKIA